MPHRSVLVRLLAALLLVGVGCTEPGSLAPDSHPSDLTVAAAIKGDWQLSTTGVPILDLGLDDEGYEINSRGEVLLGSAPARIWYNGTLTTPPVFRARALNNRGDVAGHDLPAQGDCPHAVISRRGELASLETPTGWDFSFALALASSGQAAGQVGLRSASPTCEITQSRGVLWTKDGTHLLDNLPGGDWSQAHDINTSEVSVGQGGSSGGRRAILWRGTAATNLGTLAAGNFSVALAINESDQVTGYSSLGPGTSDPNHAFLWESGVMTDLGTLGGVGSIGRGINDWGNVVGSSSTAGGEAHAFLWTGGPLIDLGTLGGDLSRANAISNRGYVIGVAKRADGKFVAVIWDVSKIP